ncbi:hypothetical protein LX70_03682 [Defluviimonas denitrificans]|jgi:hypothetical protein|uniref:Uncharacterized protein n=1 Tax=Albidovulum denitrificans TaxID=404881 RepID=A0A2S8S316_9RHOB|nr:hypothetical protein [Defluviimonas denitrificans]PQV55164.1 hypothetical protein LX70_03682 [Defluviimonas denitrificans]
MDKFADYPTTLTAPGRDAIAIVPDDLGDLSMMPRALFVGQGGNLTVRMAGGQDVTFEAVSGGTILPVRVRRVYATGTTASALVALW